MDGDLEFFFGNNAVGYFEHEAFPTADGNYQYVPYRGPGHFEMREALRATGAADCWYALDGVRVTFTVAACPEYGVLRLSDFGKGA